MDGDGVAAFVEVGTIDLVVEVPVHEAEKGQGEIDADEEGDVAEDDADEADDHDADLGEEERFPTAGEEAFGEGEGEAGGEVLAQTGADDGGHDEDADDGDEKDLDGDEGDDEKDDEQSVGLCGILAEEGNDREHGDHEDGDQDDGDDHADDHLHQGGPEALLQVVAEVLEIELGDLALVEPGDEAAEEPAEGDHGTDHGDEEAEGEEEPVLALVGEGEEEGEGGFEVHGWGSAREWRGGGGEGRVDSVRKKRGRKLLLLRISLNSGRCVLQRGP